MFAVAQRWGKVHGHKISMSEIARLHKRRYTRIRRADFAAENASWISTLPSLQVLLSS